MSLFIYMKIFMLSIFSQDTRIGKTFSAILCFVRKKSLLSSSRALFTVFFQGHILAQFKLSWMGVGIQWRISVDSFWECHVIQNTIGNFFVLY